MNRVVICCLLLCAAKPLLADAPPYTPLLEGLLAAETAAPDNVRALAAQVRGDVLADRVSACLKIRALGAGAAGAALSLSELLFAPAADSPVLELGARRARLADFAVSALAAVGDLGVAPLVLATSADSAETREAAGAALREAKVNLATAPGARQAVPPLTARLASPTEAVRYAAVVTLGAIHDGRAAAPLVALALRAAEPRRVRLAAVRAVGAFDDASAERLRPALSDTDWAVRDAVVEVLAERRPLPVEALLAALGDARATVREEAVFGLRHATDARVAPAVAALLKDPEPEVRQAAAEALGALGDARTLDALVAAALDAAQPLEVRLAALRAAGDMNDASVPERLHAAWHDPDAVVRAAMVEIMAQRKPLPLDSLIFTLADADAKVRAAALEGLREARGPRVEPAVAALLKDPEPAVREAAAETLATLPDAAAVPALMGALNDKSREVREQAAYGLGARDAKEAVPALLTLAADPDGDVREVAANVLGRLKDKRAVEPLIAMLGDPEPATRKAALSALRAITGQKLGADAVAWEKWWSAQGHP
jgi:HEAT repeat protein